MNDTKQGLRERLAQMGEVARVAGDHTGQPWSPDRVVLGGARVEHAVNDASGYSIMASSDSLLGDVHDVAMGKVAAHIATFSPDVAAALVAVAVQAERGQRHFSTECGTDPDQGIFHAVMASRRDDMKAALNALAAALGVSR